MSEPDDGLRPWLAPEQSREMPGTVDEVEHAHGIVFDPVKDQLIPADLQHSDVFHLRVARWMLDADLRLCSNLRKDHFHGIEQALGGVRVIAGNVGADFRQVLPDDSRMVIDPQGFASLAAAFLTWSFQSGSRRQKGSRVGKKGQAYIINVSRDPSGGNGSRVRDTAHSGQEFSFTNSHGGADACPGL